MAHWADPLKDWGDVLVKQGTAKDALAKYDEALKYAPNWKQLKAARQATAKQKSWLGLPRSGDRRQRLNIAERVHDGRQYRYSRSG
jgi:hypothetical protein